jgi:hypothetical protein
MAHLGWVLQVQTNGPGAGLGTNWQNVTGSTATNLMIQSLDTVDGSIFFRLAYP